MKLLLTIPRTHGSLQATAVAGTEAGGGLSAPLLPDADSTEGVSMAIDRIDRTVVAKESLVGPGGNDEDVERRGSVGLGLAVASMRTVVMVVLASLAILVVLPAALAAQAAVGI
jgi:hypothetical protein